MSPSIRPHVRDESKTLARKILRSMVLEKEAIKESCRWYEQWGGYCDCEVIMNVVGQWWGDGDDWVEEHAVNTNNATTMNT